MTMEKDFDDVPVLDFSLVDDRQSRQTFLHQLRDAASNVGFIYLKVGVLMVKK